METFGEAVRRLREAKGLTVSRLAEESDIQKGYVSMIELRRVGPPSRKVVEAMERVLGVTDGYLRKLADWEQTPPPVRKQAEGWADQAAMGQAFAAWLRDSTSRKAGGGKNLDALWKTGALKRKLDAVLGDAETYAPAESEPTIRPARLRIPLINKVAAGYPTGFTDLDYPARVADEYVPNAGVADPDAFAASVCGESMLPEYKEGDVIIFSPAADVENGSDCFVRLEPDHDTTFKRVFFEDGDRVRLQPLNPAFAPKIVERTQIAGMYKAVWRMSKL